MIDVAKEYANTQQALVAIHGEVTTAQSNDLLKLMYESSIGPKAIAGFMRREDMGLQDKIDCVAIAVRHGTMLGSVALLYESGLDPGQVEDFIMYKRELEQRPLPRRKEGQPDLSDHVSYENLLFLDNLTGNTHNIDVINVVLSDIDDRLKESEYELGIAHVLHMMRGIQDEYRGIVTPDALIDVALNRVPSDEDVADERDQDKYLEPIY